MDTDESLAFARKANVVSVFLHTNAYLSLHLLEKLHCFCGRFLHILMILVCGDFGFLHETRHIVLLVLFLLFVVFTISWQSCRLSLCGCVLWVVLQLPFPPVIVLASSFAMCISVRQRLSSENASAARFSFWHSGCLCCASLLLSIFTAVLAKFITRLNAVIFRHFHPNSLFYDRLKSAHFIGEKLVRKHICKQSFSCSKL